MPINVKIVLIGDAMLYQMLADVRRGLLGDLQGQGRLRLRDRQDEENMMDYAAFLSGCCEECEARHFDPTGVAKVIEYSARMVADQEKLSTRFAQIKDWIEEANYWANTTAPSTSPPPMSKRPSTRGSSATTCLMSVSGT